MVFGLALSNYRLVENSPIRRIVDFEKFRTDIDSFRRIMGELTFLVRSFFFIMFGYYTHVSALLNPLNILLALIIVAGIFALRWVYFIFIIKQPVVPLVMFAPRGLITILLFLSIPAASRIPMISEEVVTLVILFSIVVLMVGNMLNKRGFLIQEEGIRSDPVVLSNESKEIRDDIQAEKPGPEDIEGF